MSAQNTGPSFAKKEFRYRGNFVGGEFFIPNDPSGSFLSRSPADFKDEIATIKYAYSTVEDAVKTAKRAFPKWRKTSLDERKAILRKYQEAIKRHEADFCELIAREVGKPLWEAETEVRSMVNKIDITIDESIRFVEGFAIDNILEGTRGSCEYRPHGVMAVVGPFNFPGHLPNGHIVPALLTGNTVVFKPSEKAAMVGQLIAECFHEAGIPEGVFNLLQGEKEVGRRLCIHESVDGVLFTGSYEVGTRIKQDTLTQHWKILVLEMGGKNPSIVWSDADLEVAVYENLLAGYLTAGQRCSATSRIMVHADLFDRFVERLHQRAKNFEINHPMLNPFMGPLVEEGSVDRYMKFLGIAVREGSEIVMRGKALDTEFQGNYVTPSICLFNDCSVEAAKKSVFQQTELFAPAVAILKVRELDEAIELANATQYGLVASVFSKDRKVFDRCSEDLQMGLINWNKSTVGASSRLPFGGLKKSGNHFPTALTATQYCAFPVSSLEVAEPKLGKPVPGLGK